jgi:hypothetical protein
MNTKKAFSVIELCVIVVITSVLSCSFLVGLKIVQDTKVATIIAESIAYKNAVMNFNNSYGVLPGNISDADLTKHFSRFPNLVTNCHSSKTQKKQNRKIITESMNNCAFYQLQASGFINQAVDIDRSMINAIHTGFTNPKSNADNNLTWHLISSNIGGGETSLPIETSIRNGYLQQNGYDDRLMLVITRSSPTTTSGKYAIVPKLNRANNNVAGLTARIAMTMDKKQDTGSPYTGSMISGRNGTDIMNGAVEIGCTELKSFLSAKSINDTAIYNSKNLDSLCITAFILPKLA